MKKLILFLATLVLFFAMTVPAFADSPEDLPIPTMPASTDITGETDVFSDVPIYGSVDPSIVSAEVTLSSYFTINPNAEPGQRFISPELTVKNTSYMPINVFFVSMRADCIGPKVVAANKYTDEQWNNLSVTESLNNIALGFTAVKNSPFFFGAEGAQTKVLITDLISQDTATLQLMAKHGLSFPYPENFKYLLVMEISVK